MVICSAVALTVKALLLSAHSIRVAIAWIHMGRSRAATAPKGPRGLRRRLPLLLPPGTRLVLVVSRLQLFPPLALTKTSMSSHLLNERGRLPCRTGASGVIFAGRLGGAEEKARGADTRT